MNIFVLKKIHLLAIIFCFYPCGLLAYEADDCISCHSDNPGKGIPQISIENYRSSVHGTIMGCEGCHSYIEEGHVDGEVSDRVDCNNCHSEKSLHGASSKNENKLECYSCHTKHNILPSNIEKSSANETQFKKLCVECHKAQYGESGYLKWFTSLRIRSHKKEDFSKKYDQTNCKGCHRKIEIHEKIEKVTDSECAECHMKDNSNAMLGRFHVASNSGPFIMGLSIITQILILAVLIFFIGFIVRPLGKSGKGRK